MKIIHAMVGLLLAVFTLNGADVSGKWSGKAEVRLPEGETRNYALQVQLAQQGEEVTGTIGEEYGERVAIQNGKVQGTKLFFEVSHPDTVGPVKFELVAGRDRLEGELKGQLDSGAVSGKVALSRTP
jgi:hypothetical protein